MVARLIRLGWVQKLDKANIPNAANLEDALVNVEFDKGRVYSLPWQSGFTGIAYNPAVDRRQEVESIDQLLTDPSLKGKVTLLTEMRDTVGLMMLALGKDPANFTDADFDAAIAELQKAKDAGQIRGFTGNDYAERPRLRRHRGLPGLDRRRRAAAGRQRRSWATSCPSRVTCYWSDNFVIPNQAQHKKNAETLINYYYDPEVMAAVEDYVNYISPVKGSKEELVKTDPDVANNQLIFPSAETSGPVARLQGPRPPRRREVQPAVPGTHRRLTWRSPSTRQRVGGRWRRVDRTCG